MLSVPKVLALASLPLGGDYRLAHPLWLTALALIPLAIWFRGRRRVPVMLVPFAATWHRPSLASASRWPETLACVGLTLLVVALARPQRVEDKREVHSQGYDIILAIDLSGSMMAEDYEKDGRPLSRLQAVKPVIQSFINDRPSDRIGLVVFSGRAYTLAPLTFDHEWLARQTERLRLGMIEDGTAIGDGLGIAMTRLDQAQREEGNRRKGAFVVLLTDGANNRGVLAPMQAAEIAKSRSIPVYTMGAGKDGWVPFPVYDERTGERLGTTRRLSDLDEGALRQIANLTGGRYFKVDDVNAIQEAFKAIDKAQKIEFQAKSYLITTELFIWPAAAGSIVLLIGALISRRISFKTTFSAASSTPPPVPSGNPARSPAA